MIYFIIYIFFAVVEPPEAPILSVISSDSFAILLQLEQPNVEKEEDIMFYYISYVALNGSTEGMMVSDRFELLSDLNPVGTAFQKNIDRLRFNTQYNFSVLASNPIGNSTISMISGTTLSQIGK